MIVILTPTPESRAAEAFASFANVVHGHTPYGHAIDLHTETQRERGICADCEKRVVPTRQGLCPHCAGYLHDAAHVAKMQEMSRRLAA
jgi:hypothetical protein